MFNLNTIFKKLFVSVIATILLSMILLGLLNGSMFRNLMITFQSDLMEKSGKKVIKTFVNNYISNLDVFSIDMITRLNIEAELGVLRNYIDFSMVVTLNGSIDYYYNFDKSKDLSLYKIDISKFSNETTVFQSKLNGLFDETNIIVACPIITSNGVRGYVLVCTPVTSVQNSIQEIYIITALCVCVSLIISSILVYITSKKISNPIVEISEAAKIIAVGNFSKKINIDTSDEVGRLADAFNNMADSLNNQEKARREFIANISHDFRSPLTSMSGFLEAMIDGTIPDYNRNKYLKIVLEETKRLSKLANDIMQVNKASADLLCLTKEIFDFNELIRKTIISFESIIEAKKIDVVINFDTERASVYADYEKIKRVVYNLIDNSVKFTNENGQIKINVRETDSGKSYAFDIYDNGIGIEKENIHRIFERFYKADSSRSENANGSGLGLSIVQEFLKAHNEAIIVESEPYKGTLFTFSLPKIKPDK